MKLRTILVLFGAAVLAGMCVGIADAQEDHKIVICHVPPGNPANAHEIEVDLHAWNNGHTPHNNHSLDYVGDCRGPVVPTATPIPPTNTPVPTETVAPTPTRVDEPTSTPTLPPPDPTDTPYPTLTDTPGPEPTASATPACTDGPTDTPEPTATQAQPTPTTEPASCTCEFLAETLLDSGQGVGDDDRLQFILIGAIALVNIVFIYGLRGLWQSRGVY